MIITNHEISLFNAFTQVLFIRIGRGHLPFFVGHKGIETNLICFRITNNDSFVTKLGFCINGE